MLDRLLVTTQGNKRRDWESQQRSEPKEKYKLKVPNRNW